MMNVSPEIKYRLTCEEEKCPFLYIWPFTYETDAHTWADIHMRLQHGKTYELPPSVEVSEPRE